MNWLERRDALRRIKEDLLAAEVQEQVRRNMRKLLEIVDAINEQLGNHGNEEW